MNAGGVAYCCEADDGTKAYLREVSQVSLSISENTQKLRNECSICSYLIRNKP